jgi:hypothetical protein
VRALVTSRSRPSYRVEIRPLLVATIQRLPQRTIESIFPTPGIVSPRTAFHTPFGPSKTAVPPLTSRIVHPSMVVGLVSGTGAGLVEAFVRSTAGGCGALVACFVSEDSVVWALSFEVSCVLVVAVVVAVATVFAGEPCTASRFDLAVSGGSAESSLTRNDAGLTVKKSEFNPSIHPKQRTSASTNAPMIIVIARRVTSRAGAATTRSRLSSLMSPPHADAASGGVVLTLAIGGAPGPLFKSAAPLFAEGTAGLSWPMEEASELALTFCEWTGSVGHFEAASA